MEETFNNDNENDNERDEKNVFDQDYFKYIENNNFINSASVKKDEDKNMKRINSFENLEEEFHSNTELNKKIKIKKKKEKENTNEEDKQIKIIQKKTSRKFDNNKKKKKNYESKTKTEINDYQYIKEKNQKKLENFSGFQDFNEEYYNNIMYDDDQDKADGIIKTLDDFDAHVNVNQQKEAYECKTNVDESVGLNMFISSEINK